MNRLFYLLGNRDALAGLTIVAVCAVAWWLTTGFDEVPAMLSQNVPPTFFPRLVIGAAALLGALLIVDGIRRAAGEPAGPATAGDSSALAGQVGRAALPSPVFWATAGAIAAAGVLVPLVGTLPTIGLVAIVLPLIWGERRYRHVAVLALGLPGGIWAVFTVGLGVRFPIGRIWTLL